MERKISPLTNIQIVGLLNSSKMFYKLILVKQNTYASSKNTGWHNLKLKNKTRALKKKILQKGGSRDITHTHY